MCLLYNIFYFNSIYLIIYNFKVMFCGSAFFVLLFVPLYTFKYFNNMFSEVSLLQFILHSHLPVGSTYKVILQSAYFPHGSETVTVSSYLNFFLSTITNQT